MHYNHLESHMIKVAVFPRVCRIVEYFLLLEFKRFLSRLYLQT